MIEVQKERDWLLKGARPIEEICGGKFQKRETFTAPVEAATLTKPEGYREFSPSLYMYLMAGL